MFVVQSVSFIDVAMQRKAKSNLPTEKELDALRRNIIEIAYLAKGGHIGGALSLAEIVSVLYQNILNVRPKDPGFADRDRFILSKGHGCLAVYVMLADLGFFPKKELELYCTPKGILPGHTTITIPGVEASTGSLGHGLPIGVGMAYAAKLDKKSWRTFVVLSDGDCQEGSTWEAVMAAGAHKLDNLVAIVDYNNLCSFEPVTEMFENFSPLSHKFAAFGWSVQELDGHNVQEIYKALRKIPFRKGKPSVVIARTIKGKGVSFMENNPAWHYKAPSEEDYRLALAELGG